MHIYAEGGFCAVNRGSQRPKGLNVKAKLMIIDKLNYLDFLIVISEFFFVFSITLWPRTTLLPDNQR